MRESKRENEDKDLGSIISKMMKAWGLEEKMKEIDLVNAWPELMGNGVAYRTERLTVKNGILHLKINSSEMREELLFGKAVIIKRVNDFAGYEMIRDIWFT